MLLLPASLWSSAHDSFIPVSALVDSGSPISLISPHTGARLGVNLKALTPVAGLTQVAGAPLTATGAVDITVNCNGRQRIVRFGVAAITHDAIFGAADAGELGIGLDGVSLIPHRAALRAEDEVLNAAAGAEPPAPPGGDSAAGAVPLPLPPPLHKRVLDGIEAERAAAALVPPTSAIRGFTVRLDPDPVRLSKATAAELYRRPYPVRAEARPAVEKQLSTWLKLGYVREVSPHQRFNSPLLAIKKNSGGWRICLDLRHINAILQRVELPLPRPEDIIRWLKGRRVFSTIDLKDAYFQIRLHEDSRKFTAFTFGSRAFQFMRLPFGSASASGIFSRIAERVLAGFESFARTYLDDCVLASDDVESHIVHVNAVLQRLRSFGARINPTKSHFGLSRIEILGFVADGTSCQVARQRTNDYRKLQRPTTGRGVARALGILNFSRKHIARFAETAAAINELRGLKRIPDAAWTARRTLAWDALIRAASAPTALFHPADGLPYTIMTDASDAAIAAVIGQHHNSQFCPVDVFCRKLSKAEERYGSAKRELLAVVEGLRRFRMYVLGTNFTVACDNRAIVDAISGVRAHKILHAWLDELFEFDGMTLKHIAGSSNILPDGLSRMFSTLSWAQHAAKCRIKPLPPTISAPPPATPSAIRAPPAPRTAATAPASASSTAPPSALSAPADSRPTVNNVVALQEPLPANRALPALPDIAETRLVAVDAEAQRAVLQRYHDAVHLSGGNLANAIAEAGFIWPTLARDAGDWVANCPACIANQVVRTGYHPARSIKADAPWDVVMADYCTFDGRSVLLLVDVATRFTVLRVVPDHTAATLERTLFDTFMLLGWPLEFASDNELAFKADSWIVTARAHGTEPIFVTPNYPMGNAVCERKVRALKEFLERQGPIAPHDFVATIARAQYALNANPTTVTRSAPGALFFGRLFPIHTGSLDAAAVDAERERRVVARSNALRSIVMPATLAAAHARLEQQREALDSRRHVVDPNDFSPGSSVVMRTRRRTGEARFIGPFSIVRLNRAGAAILRRDDGSILSDPANLSNLVRCDRRPLRPELALARSNHERAAQPDLTADAYPVRRITGHRTNDGGELELQIDWQPSWLPRRAFGAGDMIRRYLSRHRLNARSSAGASAGVAPLDDADSSSDTDSSDDNDDSLPASSSGVRASLTGDGVSRQSPTTSDDTQQPLRRSDRSRRPSRRR